MLLKSKETETSVIEITGCSLFVLCAAQFTRSLVAYSLLQRHLQCLREHSGAFLTADVPRAKITLK